MSETAPKLDPRRHVYREDLAAETLKDKIKAPRYASGELRQIVGAIAPVRIAPYFDAPLGTQALFGELATVYEVKNHWAWVQLENDGYVGYVPVDNLSTMIEEPTHWVRAHGTFVYPAPDLKRPPITRLSFRSKISVLKREGRFAELSRGGYVFIGHLAPFDEKAKDFVTQAESFAGVPYLWGGRSCIGLDCSALVQLGLQATGVSCPRDSDMQEQETGEKLEETKTDKLKRGDLVFWRGHVGIARSETVLLHASGHDMTVVSEETAKAVERIAKTHGDVTSIRRIKDYKPA